MILYRPVGLKELKLIAQAGYTAFPPRLPEQPIFYPVLSFEYAEQIAQDWNSKSGEFAGFVTRFEVDDAYASRFPVHVVGRGDIHQELWVLAEELEEFNKHIVSGIAVEAAYYGDQFEGEVDAETGLPANLVVQHGRSRQTPAEAGSNHESDRQLERDPRFLRRVKDARESVRQGRGVRLEDIDVTDGPEAS